jgi:hypothetical protein
MGEKKNSCIIFVGRPERKRPRERPKRRRENSIRMYLREIGWVV